MAVFRPEYLPKVGKPAGLSPVPLDRFGGLNLRDDPQEVGWGGAVDLLNVTVDDGRVRTRPGYTSMYSEPGGGITQYGGLAVYGGAATTPRIVVGGVGAGVPSLRALGATDANADGIIDATLSSIATFNGTGRDGRWTWAQIGTGAALYLYACDGSSLTRFNGTSFTAAAGNTYSPHVVGMQPADNRLVLVDTNGYRVRFSNPGAPETFGTDDYVDLTPGDGENCTAIVSWNQQTFVFKESRFFVFYGNSVDSTGGTVFNYRSVDGDVGCGVAGAAAATPIGVVFANHEGIWLTTGSTPEKISTALDPLFNNGTAPYFQAGMSARDASSWSFAWQRGKLYAAFQAAANSLTLVWDHETRTWSVWSTQLAGLATFSAAAGYFEDNLYAAAAGVSGRAIFRFDDATTTDAGTGIVSRYRTGFNDLDTGAAEEVVREWLIDGTGTPTLKVAVNNGSLDAGQAVTLGTAPQVAQGRRRYASRGRNWSVELGASSGAWSVSRVVAHVRGRRPDGTKAP